MLKLGLGLCARTGAMSALLALRARTGLELCARTGARSGPLGLCARTEARVVC